MQISFCIFFILSAYSENMRRVFKRIWRIGDIRVVCGTHYGFRIRGKNLCIHGEDAKKHKTENMSVNNGPKWNFCISLLFLQDGLDIFKAKAISRYCPFTAGSCTMYIWLMTTFTLRSSVISLLLYLYSSNSTTPHSPDQFPNHWIW